MDDLGRLLNAHEDWLTDRVVHYAQVNGHTLYSSTLREAWRLSVVQLTKLLVQALEGLSDARIPPAKAIDEAAAYCVEAARKHQARGIDLDMFLGLLVFYRRSYIDLIEKEIISTADRQRRIIGLMEVFDAIELALVRDILGTKTDAILERLKAANRELTNEKNKYLTVFESIAEPTILIDHNDELLHMNTAGHRVLLGEDKPGLGYYGTPGYSRLRAIIDALLRHMSAEADNQRGVTLDTATGQRSFSVSCQEMLDISKKFTGRVIILQDVTDYLLATEAAKGAERAKSALLAMFSHEIKTPINSIIALTDLMDDDRLAPEQRRHVSELRASGRVLSDLIENILGLSRVEAKALQRLDQDFDLCDLVQGVMLLIEPAARAKGLKTSFHIAPDVPCSLHGDMHKLHHVLINLLSNAVKFTAQGSVSLNVQRDDGPGGPEAPACGLKFEVADTGPGLPRGAIDWIFDPFTQHLHTGLEQSLCGAGLGLAICREFVSFLGGSITARSAPGGGSVFAFDLPFRMASLPCNEDTPQASLDVLVVEDDPVNALVTESYLTELGHRPVVVGSYADALEQLRRLCFDVVVTDHHLPGTTGVDFARHLRYAQDSFLNRLPIILVTAIEPDPTDLLPNTVQYIIRKPIERGVLARAIQHVLRQGARSGYPPDLPPTHQGDGTVAESTFDRRLLDQMLNDLGLERCRRIIDSYLESAPRLADDLHRDAPARDLFALCETAHKLVGAANVVGMTAVASHARHLLDNCKAGNKSQMKSDVAELRDHVHQSCRELQEYLAASTGDAANSACSGESPVR